MYELFLDAVSTHGRVALLRGEDIIYEETITLAGNESSLLGAKIFSFLESHGVSPSELGRIYVVRGPGSFTGIRSICLFCNTLSYIYPQLTLCPLSFFDLYESYPIVKQSSRRDVFVKSAKNATIEILPIMELQDLLVNYTQVYGSFELALLGRDTIELQESYHISDILRGGDLTQMKYIEPLYIKHPNIS